MHLAFCFDKTLELRVTLPADHAAYGLHATRVMCLLSCACNNSQHGKIVAEAFCVDAEISVLCTQ